MKAMHAQMNTLEQQLREALQAPLDLEQQQEALQARVGEL